MSEALLDQAQSIMNHNVPSGAERFFRWLAITLIGIGVGHFWLESFTEPIAVGSLYKIAAKNALQPRIRIIDLSHLYEVYSPTGNTLSPLPSKVIKNLLKQIENLPDDSKPAAIGFDFPILDASINGVVRRTERQTDILKSIIEFRKRQHIPVRIALPITDWSMYKTKMAYLYDDNIVASSYTYVSGEMTPLWFGTGAKSDSVPVLGLATALDGLGKDRIEPEIASLQSIHNINPPNEWPKSFLLSRWIYVDYSILKNRDDITITVGSALQEGDDISQKPLFTQEGIKKLKSESNRKNIWFIGVTKVLDREDIFSYEERSQWISDSEPVRRIYEHGSIAHTYMDAPLRRMDDILSKFIDLICSLSGLMFILYLDNKYSNMEVLHGRSDKFAKSVRFVIYSWGKIISIVPSILAWLLCVIARNKSKPGPNLIKILGATILIPLPIIFSAAFAWNHIFWFGFVATATYGLVEPVLDGTLENIK